MYRVDFSPESERHFRKLHRWIRKQASMEIADNYTAAIARFCEDLHTFPHRGTKREDLRPGLRTMGFRYRVSVAFSVSDKEQLVSILGIFYGGRSLEKAFAKKRP